MTSVQLADVTLATGNASLTPELGGYYLDLSGALPLVETGWHGPLDAAGVPFSSGAQGDFYNAITIAQYALALQDALLSAPQNAEKTAELERKLRTQMEFLLTIIEQEGEYRGFFVHRWDNPKYRELRAPWVSALSQGNMLSALLRAYQSWGDERFLEQAHLVFAALERPLSEGGTRFVDASGDTWFEEYPMNPPSHVLNGFIFALWGILDYARVTNDPQAWEWWQSGLATLKRRLPDYDCGYWSVYDLKFREPASLYYQNNIHVLQMRALYELTQEPIFDRYARRWAKFGTSRFYRALWWIGVRVQARFQSLRGKPIGAH